MSNEKEIFINIIKECFDILRNKEFVTGKEALEDISYFLILKFLEPMLDKIKFEEYDYPFKYECEGKALEERSKALFNTLRFSNLSNKEIIDEQTIPDRLKNLIDDILSEHPITNNIFNVNCVFKIKNYRTYKKIIDKLNTFQIKEKDYDLLGAIYESELKNNLVGKTFGQYFTPETIRKFIIKLIDPKIMPNGRCETICDPAMGTAGFLTSSLRYIKNKAEECKIELDWESITSAMHGNELLLNTFQLAFANMLIRFGHLFKNIKCDDSLRIGINNKFDIVLANPPFGLEDCDYNEITYKNGIKKEEYIPIKSNNGVHLFVQLIITRLNIGGRGAVIVPCGEHVYGKDKEFIMLREFLFKTCEVKEFIILPKGIFTNTTIETGILYFYKRKDSIEEKQELSSFATKLVKIYNYNEKTEDKDFLAEIKIEQLIENKFSLNHLEYIEEEKKSYADGVEVKSLGDIGKFLKKSKRKASYGKEEGKYPFFTSSNTVSKYVDEPDFKEESLIIGDGGSPNFNYGTNFSTSDHCYVLKIKSDILTKYIYYYLRINCGKFKNLYMGLGVKNISKEKIKKIKIPIPPLEIQKRYIDFAENFEKNFYNEVPDIIKALNEKNKTIIKGIDTTARVYKRLGDICKIVYGKRVVKKNIKAGPYPVYGGGNVSYTYELFNRDGFNIVISRFGVSPNCVRLLNGKIYLNDSAFSLEIKSNDIVNRYLGYYLINIQERVYRCARGPAQKAMDISMIKKIQIPIISLERQTQLIEILDKNNEYLKQLEEQNKCNEDLKKLMIKGLDELLSFNGSNDECDNDSSNDCDNDNNSDNNSDNEENNNELDLEDNDETNLSDLSDE